MELIIYPDPLCTSCEIYLMNKKAGFKNPLKPNVLFKWFYGYYSSNITKKLISETNFSKSILTVDEYSKTPKLYGMERITI